MKETSIKRMASTAWMRLRIIVRWPTRALRRPVSSRSCRVAASGCQTSGRKSQRRSWARTWASTLSVFTLAWAMALVAMGLETTTLATCGRRASATAQQLVVASRATWSLGRRTFVAKSSSVRRFSAKRSRWTTLPVARRGRPRPRACGHQGRRNVHFRYSWEFLPCLGKTEGTPARGERCGSLDYESVRLPR